MKFILKFIITISSKNFKFCFNRSRLGKINRKQLHKAATLMFRARQDEIGKKYQKLPPRLPAKSENDFSKKDTDTENGKKQMVENVNKLRRKETKKPIKGFNGLKAGELMSYSDDYKLNQQEDGLKLSASTDTDMTISSKGEVATLESRHKEHCMHKNRRYHKMLAKEKAAAENELNVINANGTFSFPSPDNFSSRYKYDKILNAVNALKYSKFGIVPHKHSPFLPLPKGRVRKEEGRSLCSIPQKNAQLDMKLSEALERDSFMIVKPVLESRRPVQKLKHFRTQSPVPIIIDKHHMPKIERQYKYSDKYNGPPAIKVKSKVRICSKNRAKTKMRSRTWTNNTGSTKSEHSGRKRDDGAKPSKGNPSNKKSRHPPKAEMTKAKSAQIARRITEQTERLHKETEDIDKRVKVQTKGIDLFKFSKLILQRYC